MQPFQDFSSWQPEQERQFVVFEQRTVEASKRAWAIGLFAGIAFGIAVVAITVAVPTDVRKMESAASTTPDLGSEAAPAATVPSAATTPAPEAAPAAAPATAPAATDPAAATATDPAAAQPAADPGAASGAADSAGATTAPPPPPGATKAPPTDLVKGQK